MKVFFNGELQKNIISLESLKTLIEKLRLECKKNKQILEMIVDGKSVEKLPIGFKEREFCKVELKSKSTIEFIIENMMDSFNYIPDLRRSLSEVTTLFQQGAIGQGIELFQQCIDGLIWLNHLLANLQLYLFDNREYDLESSKYQDDIDKFNRILDDLTKSWENEDYVLISDLIDYELDIVLDNWQKNFAEILDIFAGVN